MRVLPVVLAQVLAAGAARADVTEACVRESEDAQLARDAGRFLEAKALLVSCARPACPTIVRRDCADFLSELERRIPTVVLAARSERGDDIGGVRVLVDGGSAPVMAGAMAVSIDPGAHTFRFEADGYLPAEKSVIVREGEKARTVDVVLAARATLAVVAPPRARETRDGVPVLSWVLGGTAVAGGLAFGALSLLAVDEAKDLERTCAPRCSDDAISPIETKFTIARAAGGVAVAAAVLAVMIYVLRDSKRPQPVTVSAF